MRRLGPAPEVLREAWLLWSHKLGVEWAWWFTGTFARPGTTVDSARKAWQWWIRPANYAVLGARRGRREQIPWLRVIEGDPHGSTPVHVHAVIAGTEPLSMREFYDRWVAHFGWAELEAFEPGIGGLAYLVKDVGEGAEFLPSPCLNR